VRRSDEDARLSEQIHADSIVTERVTPDRLYSRLRELRDAGFTMLLDLGGVDYPDRPDRFEVVYHLLKLPLAPAGVYEIARPERRRILVAVGGEKPTLSSIVDLWPAADWAEREVYDLFGVHFQGHPDLRRIQMPDDWEGHPLRRDYPLRGPARDAAPRPNFSLKGNVGANVPATPRTEVRTHE